jgi:hypothetical protein
MSLHTFTVSTVVPIVDSFTGPYLTMTQNLPAAETRTFNSLLPKGAKGIYIGAAGTYDLFVEFEGTTGIVFPVLGMLGQRYYEMNVTRLHSSSRYTTDAPNILVLY